MGFMRWVPNTGQLKGRDPIMDAMVGQLVDLARRDDGSGVWTCSVSDLREGRYRVQFVHAPSVAGWPEPSPERRAGVRFELEGTTDDVVRHFATWLARPWKDQ
jgi:hypothetical protein